MVAIGTDQRLGFLRFKERQQVCSRLVVARSREQYRILANRGVKFVWNNPHRTRLDLAVLDYLGKRDKTQVSIAAFDEAVSLPNTLAQYKFWLKRPKDAESVQGFHRCSTIRRQFWRGHRQVLESTRFEDVALFIHHAGFGGPEHQPARRVGESTADNSPAFFFKRGGSHVIGGKKNIKWRAVGDLSVELTGRGKRQQYFVASFSLKFFCNPLHGRGEISRYRNLDFTRQS